VISRQWQREGGGGAHIYERNSKKAGTPSLIKEGHLLSWIFPYFINFFFFPSLFFPHPFRKCINVANVNCPEGGGLGSSRFDLLGAGCCQAFFFPKTY